MPYGLVTTVQSRIKTSKTTTKAQFSHYVISSIIMTSYYYFSQRTVIIFKISMQFRFIKLCSNTKLNFDFMMYYSI